LKIFEILLSLHEECVIQNLILRNLVPGFHVLWKEDRYYLRNVKDIVKSLMNLWLDCNSVLLDYSLYKTKATSRIIICNQECKEWKHKIMEKQFTLVDQEYISQLGGGLFIYQLLLAFNRFFENSLEVNEVLTRILLLLTHYPIPILYTFLFNDGESLQTNVPCVFKIVTQQLNKTIKERMPTIPDFTGSVSRIVKHYYQPHLPDFQQQKRTNDENSFVLAVALLGDFLSEWCATLSVYGTTAKQRRVYQTDQQFRLSRSLEKENQDNQRL